MRLQRKDEFVFQRPKQGGFVSENDFLGRSNGSGFSSQNLFGQNFRLPCFFTGRDDPMNEPESTSLFGVDR